MAFDFAGEDFAGKDHTTVCRDEVDEFEISQKAVETLNLCCQKIVVPVQCYLPEGLVGGFKGSDAGPVSWWVLTENRMLDAKNEVGFDFVHFIWLSREIFMCVCDGV